MEIISDIPELKARAGLVDDDLCALFDVTPATLRRYKKNFLPRPYLLLLRVLAGWMPWHGWEDWSIDKAGYLRDDAGRYYWSRADLERMDFYWRQPLSLRLAWQQAEIERSCSGNVVALHSAINRENIA